MLLFLLGFAFLTQAVGNTFVPPKHIFIGLLRKGFLGQQLGEDLAGARIQDVELLDGALQEGHMLVRAQ